MTENTHKVVKPTRSLCIYPGVYCSEVLNTPKSVLAYTMDGRISNIEKDIYFY